MGPLEDSVAAVDGMGMTESPGCLSSCAAMSVGGLSDGTAGSGSTLREGAGGVLWTVCESVPGTEASIPGAAFELSAVAVED